MPAGGVVGMSSPCAWLATLGTGSVAATSIQVLAPCSRRQPVTLTISTFFVRRLRDCERADQRAARQAMHTRRYDTRRDRFDSTRSCSLGRSLRARACGCDARSARAHEAERTRVTLTLAADGSFVLDVANDPMWLLLRLETFAGGSVPADLTRRRSAMRGSRNWRRSSPIASCCSSTGTKSRADRGRVRAACRDQRSGIGDRRMRWRTFRLDAARCRATRRGCDGSTAWSAIRYPLEIRQPDGSSTIEWIEARTGAT